MQGSKRREDPAYSKRGWGGLGPLYIFGRKGPYLLQEKPLSLAKEAPSLKRGSKDREIEKLKGKVDMPRKLLRRKRGADKKAK